MENLNLVEYLEVLYTNEKELFNSMVVANQAALITTGPSNLRAVEVSQIAILQARTTMDAMGYGYERYLSKLNFTDIPNTEYIETVNRYLAQGKITPRESESLLNWS